MPALLNSSIPELPVRRGKVRDVYTLPGDLLLIVASDRISAFDVIMPTGIPDKGRILTQLSNFWFELLGKGFRFEHHLVETEAGRFPGFLRPHASWLAGRAVVVKHTQVVPIECVVRGYITGSGWKDYQAGRAVSGVKLAEGLRQCEKLAEPIFTPTTKAEAGHDMPIAFEDACGQIGRELMMKCRDLAIGLYSRASDYAAGRGILIADTKFEFGTRADVDGGGTPILIDEALTPDSSRFWPADGYEVGRDQASFDKQYLRNYLETLSWGKVPPGPELPSDVVRETRAKYVEGYERLTGRTFA